MKKNIWWLFIFLVISCSENETKKYDNCGVIICVVDSIWIKQPISTLDFNIKYYYHTNCNKTITTYNRRVYNIGDTVVYVGGYE